MRAAAMSRSFCRRPVRYTNAPSLTNRCAVASPRPLLPPVITATLPCNLGIILFLSDSGTRCQWIRQVCTHRIIDFPIDALLATSFVPVVQLALLAAGACGRSETAVHCGTRPRYQLSL